MTSFVSMNQGNESIINGLKFSNGFINTRGYLGKGNQDLFHFPSVRSHFVVNGYGNSPFQESPFEVYPFRDDIKVNSKGILGNKIYQRLLKLVEGIVKRDFSYGNRTKCYTEGFSLGIIPEALARMRDVNVKEIQRFLPITFI